MNEKQKEFIKLYPHYENLVRMYNDGYFDEIKGVSSNRIFDGDIIRSSSRGVCVIEIQGPHKMDDKGFLISLEDGSATRAEWTYLRVLNRM